MADKQTESPIIEPVGPPIIHTGHTTDVDRSLDLILDGEDATRVLANLDPTSLEFFYELIDSIRQGNDKEALDRLWRVDYIKAPPTIEEFIDDPYWLGEVTCHTDENEGIFPIWRKVLLTDFDLDSKIHNAVVTGSLGVGKSFISVVILLYRIALARLLRNPYNFFSMSRGTQLFYTIISITRAQVQETAFGDALNFMANSPFFIEECGFDPNMMYRSQVIDLGNNVMINAGSKGWHFIGKSVMGILFDEGNFRIESNPNLKAYQMFNEARKRFKSRFQKKATYLPAISLLSSSAADESSFTEQIVKEIAESGDPHQKVYRFSTYVARAHLLEDLNQDRWFRVSYGLRNIEPTILRGWFDADGKLLLASGTPEEQTLEQPAPGCSVEYVPERYFDVYRRDCRGSLQAISGISVGGTHRLFPSTIDIEICIDMAIKDGLKNPCLTELMPISMEDDKNVWDYLDHNSFLMLHRSQVVPRRHPDMLRFAHIDLATETMAGVSICHLLGRQLVEDQKLGEVFKEYRLIVEYDFVLTIIAGQRKPISIGKIFNFFFWLRDKCGFHFGLITADQWQSVLPLQTLEAAGFNVGNVSLDRTSAPYHEWRRGFSEHRIRTYRQNQMIKECEALLDFGDRVEKPEGGSKDTTDGAAGAYWNAVSSASEMGKQTTSAPPSVFQENVFANEEAEKPPIEIPVNIEHPQVDSITII